MFPTRVSPQSGEGISRCITSDCLSRLENHEQTGFDEEVVRDVAGAMFSGEPCPEIPFARAQVLLLSAAAASETVRSEMIIIAAPLP